MECPCDRCITRAMCLNREYDVLMGCKLVRIYLDIHTTGNTDVKKLKLFCESMKLTLRSHRISPSYATTAYYIDYRKEKSYWNVLATTV